MPRTRGAANKASRTPDLLPGDVVDVVLFNQVCSAVVLHSHGGREDGVFVAVWLSHGQCVIEWRRRSEVTPLYRRMPDGSRRVSSSRYDSWESERYEDAERHVIDFLVRLFELDCERPDSALHSLMPAEWRLSPSTVADTAARVIDQFLQIRSREEVAEYFSRLYTPRPRERATGEDAIPLNLTKRDVNPIDAVFGRGALGGPALRDGCASGWDRDTFLARPPIERLDAIRTMKTRGGHWDTLVPMLSDMAAGDMARLQAGMSDAERRALSRLLSPREALLLATREPSDGCSNFLLERRLWYLDDALHRAFVAFHAGHDPDECPDDVHERIDAYRRMSETEFRLECMRQSDDHVYREAAHVYEQRRRGTTFEAVATTLFDSKSKKSADTVQRRYQLASRLVQCPQDAFFRSMRRANEERRRYGNIVREWEQSPKKADREAAQTYKLVLDGRRYEDVAEARGIDVRTVNRHVRRVREAAMHDRETGNTSAPGSDGPITK
jgi:hypothetical protein